MAETLKLGNGIWATKENSLLSYNDENGNYKPLPFDFTRASSATVVNKAGLIETVGTGTPRIDFLGNTNGALLLEPQRTNLYAYSEDFSNAAWTKSSSTVTITSNVAPDGTTNSVYNLTGTSANLYTGGTAGIEYTISVYAKSNGQGKDNFKLRLGNNVSSSIIVTDEWVRYEFTSTPTTTVFGLTVDSSPNNEWDILIWGAQLEQASYPTSYIPTQGSTVTRVKDACLGAGNDQVINSTEGVFYFEGSALANDGTNRFLSIDDGTTANYIYFRYTTDDNQCLFRTNVGGVTINTLSTFITDATQNHKFAYKFKSGDYAMWIDGVEIATDTSPTIFAPNTLDNIVFSFPTDGGGGFASKTKDIRVYNTALTDAELQALTTI